MLSVIIPTLNAERTLAGALSALIPATIEGIVKEVIIVDGGSTDGTLELADAAGATVIKAPKGRGQQLREGAAQARHPWLLFLHADTVLERDWEHDAMAFIEAIDHGRRPPAAAAFRFELDDQSVAASIVEFGVRLRCRLCKLPYGDQGLLISAPLYREIGGFKPIPLLEDVDIVRRLGRRRIRMLRPTAITSAKRYRESGYFARVTRNWTCLTMYRLGVPIEKIAKYYG